MSSHYFPVAKSLVSTEALARVLETAYGLCGLQCQLLQATMRDVYLVHADKKPYVLLIYRHNQRTPDEITAEWRFIDSLHGQGIPVAPAILQNSGELLLTLTVPEGTRYAVLSAFVGGKHLRHRYSVEAVRRYGHAIGKIHALSDTLAETFTRPCHDFRSVVGHSLAALAPLLTHRPEDMNYLSEVAAIIQPKFDALPQEVPYYGMIHGDVIRANAQVSDNGNVTVLDFDLCGPGWRAYDVGSYLQVAGTDEAKHAFLDGYQEIRTITDAEFDLLPLFEAARHIFALGVPAMNVYHWGRACLTDTDIDASLNGLRQCMIKVG